MGLMKKFLAVLVLFIFLTSATALSAEKGNWKDRFDEICGKVQIAESLSTEEVQKLIKESEELIKRLQELDQPVKKVYIFRLKKCRSFFQYILQLRESKKEEG